MIRDTLGMEGDAGDLAISPETVHLAEMRAWLRQRHRRRPNAPLIAMAPAAAYGPAKEWPAEKFAAVIDALAQNVIGAECVLVGAPSERAKCEEVARLAIAGAIVSAGETSIGELIALLSISSAFIGNDSGCMHLAGALGIPTVAIFGSTNPLRTGPAGAKQPRDLASPRMQPVPRAHLPISAITIVFVKLNLKKHLKLYRRWAWRVAMKLKELASKLGREFRGDGEVDIFMPAPIEAAGPGTIIFVANEKYAPMLETTTASCVIVPEQFAERAKCPVLISPNPYFDFSRVLEIFFPAA